MSANLAGRCSGVNVSPLQIALQIGIAPGGPECLCLENCRIAGLQDCRRIVRRTTSRHHGIREAKPSSSPILSAILQFCNSAIVIRLDISPNSRPLKGASHAESSQRSIGRDRDGRGGWRSCADHDANRRSTAGVAGPAGTAHGGRKTRLQWSLAGQQRRALGPADPCRAPDGGSARRVQGRAGSGRAGRGAGRDRLGPA